VRHVLGLVGCVLACAVVAAVIAAAALAPLLIQRFTR
jgi:hypothetical protein